MAFDATIGGTSATSYATVVQADAYADSRMYADDWSSTSTEDKQKLLQTATRALDAQYEWNGTVASDTQALGFPRFGAYNRNGVLIASDAIPQELIDAVSEYAFQMLAADRLADSDIESLGLKNFKAGPVEFEFTGLAAAKAVPDAVAMLISHLATRRNGNARRLIRV